MKIPSVRAWGIAALLASCVAVLAHTLPPLWENGTGQTIHYQPVQWPTDAVNPSQCGEQCGDWKPYTRFSRGLTDPRVQDPSNGGTAPQNYVNVSSSCTDKQLPSVYYYLHQAADPEGDVVMFRWRVEQPAHNYATGPNAGNYSSGSPWSSALWTVLFDVDGSGYRSLAAHLNGSTGSPSSPVDMLAGIWGNTPTQSIDYSEPNVHLLGHNPTAFIGPTGKLLNFRSALNPTESWPNGASETVWDYGTTRATKVSQSPCTEYFIDYQIPVAMLDASGVNGPKITRDTPISMLFCTANSLSNPFQKDCAINRQWTASATNAAPFGDYISFNKEDPYQQPIVSSVTAEAPSSCPGTYKLTTKVQDALALQAGAVVPSVQAVEFYYWYDRNGDGEADAADIDSAWTRITPAAARVAQTMNTWVADWDASALPKGKYLIGVQALDDADALDDGMVSTGIDNRTFSYLSGGAENGIYVAGVWEAGQQAVFPLHSPARNPSADENWYGNPSVTGNQVALVGTAINTCGIAPTITLTSSPASVASGGSVNLTIAVSNPAGNATALSVSSIDAVLPAGFSYVGDSTTSTIGIGAADPITNGQELTWEIVPAALLAPGQSGTVSFTATASSTAGTYSSTAAASTSFGTLASAPASVVVDSARVSLSVDPSAYSISADGSTPLTFTLRYSNDAAVALTNAAITNALPAGATYVSCSGGLSCGYAGGDVTFTLGDMAGGHSGSVSYTLTVPNSWQTNSLLNSATLGAIAPDSSPVSATASATIAVAGAGAAEMRLRKTAGAARIDPAGSVTYTLHYENYGTATATSVVLTDTLPPGMTFGSCSDSCSSLSGVVTWNVGAVAANGSGTRTVTVNAANPFTASNPTNNVASLSWSGGGPVFANAEVGISGQACSVYYFKNAAINIAGGSYRTANTTLPASGAASSIGFVATNAAGYQEFARFYQDPETSNTVSFGVGGTLTTTFYVTKSNGPQLLIHGHVYDYDPVSDTETLLGNTSTPFSNNGNSVNQQFSFSIPVSGSLQKGHRLLWIFTASSNNSISFNYLFDAAASPTRAEYCVTPPVDLALTTTVSHAAIDENTTPTLTYTLSYANMGGTQATNVNLLNTLPEGFTGCEYSTDNANWAACSAAGATPPTDSLLLATLNGGASGTRYIRGTVPAGTVGGSTLTNTATISSDQTVAVESIAETAVRVVGGGGTPALAISLLADRSVATPGQTVTYTVTVVNVGDGSASDVVVSNALPVESYYTFSSCSGGCGNAGGTLTWPTIGTLAPGASQSYTYSMLVGTTGLPSGFTSIADDASVAASGGLSETSNSFGVTIGGNPLLVAALTPSPDSGLSPGDTIVYSLTVENTGAAAASGVAASITVPNGAAFSGDISATQGGGVFDAVANGLTYSIGTLASGATATLTFKAVVNSPLPSGNTTLINTATVSASNAPTQVVGASAVASAQPTLSITHSGPSSVPYPSAVLTAAANGTVVFVNRTDALQINQLISVDGTVARILGVAAKSIVVDTPVTAIGGTPVYAAVTLSIGYRNEGNAAATAVEIHDDLPSGLGYYASSPAAATSPITGNNGRASWSIGTLAAGASGTLELVTFPRGVTGSFTSRATIGAANAPDATADVTTAIGGLSVVKTTATPTLSAGADAEYTIVASNSLNAAATVSVTDLLPNGFSYKLNSATVGGIALEPTFDADDADRVQPIWSGVVVPASSSVALVFKATTDPSIGPAVYQNEVDVAAPPEFGVLSFDSLSTTAEDVTVLGAGTGILKGYVFERADFTNAPYDADTDTPFAGVIVQIHKTVSDCAVGTDCFVAYSDSNGYFERVVPAGTWIVTVVEGSGELESGLTQVTGTNPTSVVVPDQGEAEDQNGFTRAILKHTVDTAVGAHGSISPAGAEVIDGDTAEFTLTADSGYRIDAVSGCAGSLNANVYTTGAISAACTVTASFVAIDGGVSTYQIAATAMPANGGTIAGTGTYDAGAAVSLTASSANGYSFSHWSEGGASVSSTANFAFAAASNRTLVAHFSLAGYAIVATAGSGGSISPTNATVAHGATSSFVISPTTGYRVSNVTGCGGTLTGATYTTAAITGTCSVNVTFTPMTYMVTANAGAGGAIGPANATVSHGGTTSFAVTPSAGYGIASVSGCNGSLSGTTYTTGPITGACSVSATFSARQPQFGPAPPISVNARALFTDVPLDKAPHATDADALPLEVVLVGNAKRRPGRHILIWRAVDKDGVAATIEQVFDVWPTVSLSNDLVVGYGNGATFQIELNGDSPIYPFVVEFSVGGDGGLGIKHNLASGTVTFVHGTSASVEFDALAQSGSFPDHRLVVTLDPTINIGERGELNITLVSRNIAPQVRILATQDDRIGPLVAEDAGPIALHAIVSDANAADTHLLDWTAPVGLNPHYSSDSTELLLAERSLTAGLHDFAVLATDNGAPPLSSRGSIVLVVRKTSPILGSGDSNGNGVPDSVEGWGDAGNGIPLYLNRITQRNVLPEDAPVTDSYLVEGDPGVLMRLGAYAQFQGSGVRLTDATIATLARPDDVTNVGGYFNYEAHELSEAGQVVRAVVPQRQPIPEKPIYRLWDAKTSSWMTFVEDANNSLASALGEQGFCPPPGSTAYRPGLTPGHWCVQVSIEDGGPNDMDRQMNMAVSKMGGIGRKQTTVVTGTSSGSGGGGSMNGSMLLLGFLLWLARAARSALCLLLGIGACPLLAAANDAAQPSAGGVPAQDLAPDHAQISRWYLGASALLVRNASAAEDMDARLARDGYDTRTSLKGQSRFGWSAFGGFRHRQLGAEIGFANLGRMTTRVEGDAPITQEYLDAIGRAHPRSGSGPQFSFKGYVPLTEKIEISGRIGTIYWRGEKTADALSNSANIDARAFDPLFGAGLSYRAGARLNLSAELIQYRLDGERVSTLGAGLTYRFSGGALRND